MIAAVVLAAGPSTRLGRPKQLLAWQGRSLLLRAAQNALEAGCRPVVVVLGARARLLRAELIGLEDVEPVVNRRWSEGMARSIVCAVKALHANTRVEGALLMPCDQPDVDADVLRRLLDAYRVGGRPMAAAEFEGTLGSPAVFDRSRFDALLALEGDRGAKSLLGAEPDAVTPVPCPEAAQDIDTEDDWERLARRGPRL